MTPPVYIACVGSRETPREILEWMEKTGAELVRRGFSIVSGNAKGADQAWARGANSVDPTKVLLCLPWSNYEHETIVPGNVVRSFDTLDTPQSRKYLDIAARLHRNWGALKGGAYAMHARNIMIVESAIAVVGFLNPWKPGGGGTGMAFRAARLHFKIPARSAAHVDVRASLVEELDVLRNLRASA